MNSSEHSCHKKCGEHSGFDDKFYWTSVLLEAQEDLARSIGDFESYFAADRRIRAARRELRRLDREDSRQ